MRIAAHSPILRKVVHRRVMSRVEPLLEKRDVRVIEIGCTDPHDSLGARDALDLRPDFGQLLDHSARPPRLNTNVATSGRQRMRSGGMPPMPRLTYINTPRTR